MNPSTISDQAIKMSTDCRSKKEKKIVYRELYEASPRLFEMVLNGNFDQSILTKMMECLNKIQTSELDVHSASVEFGGVLCDRFIPKKSS